VVHIDDIIVFSKTFSEHIEGLRTVLTCLKQANLKLKAKKCYLLKSEVTFLGNRVSAKGVRPDPNNIAKIIE
jgi:hypothetical protein